MIVLTRGEVWCAAAVLVSAGVVSGLWVALCAL
jgi:hypothetical protein